MAFQTLSLGLTLTIPTSGTRNYASTLFNTTWTKISSHDHSGGGNGAPVAIGANTITTARLSKNYGYTQASTLTPTGTTQTIDFNNGNVQFLDLSLATGTVTLTLSNPSQGAWYYIWVTQGATFRDLSFPGTVKWPQAQVPILTSSGAGTVDLIMFYYNGTHFRGMWELDFS